MHDSTGASSSIKSDLQSGATENEENTLVNTVPEVTSTQDESGARTLIPPIQNQHQRTGRDSSIASTSQELWGSLISYLRSSQFGPVLALALVALIILLQASTFDLLCVFTLFQRVQSCFWIFFLVHWAFQ
jgi:hypothetical protein